MTTEVEETLKKIVARVVRKPDLDFSPAATFKDFEADSLDIVQILVAVEDNYDIEIQDDALEGVTDMGGFIAHIEKKIAEKV
ncbi:MAG TPA: acyl carrier protein [Dehalococcoidia bacterium]|nr:acyl carrier protein [Dehalococcoidia bacterium]